MLINLLGLKTLDILIMFIHCPRRYMGLSKPQELDEYNTPEALWAKAINTTCYASNRLFLQKFLGKTPYELLNGKKSDVSFFRVFGCKCYIYKKQQHLGKFQRRCDIGFLVGYSSKSKAYRVFNHATGLVEETYDVEFDESNGS